MKLVTTILLVVASVSVDGLSTGYIHEVRADLALAERVVVRPSPENGGGQYSITDAAMLRSLGKSIPRSTRVHKSKGSIATTSYVVIEVYGDRNADAPDRQITVVPKMGMFRLNGATYEFKNKNDALYKALLKITQTNNSDEARD